MWTSVLARILNNSPPNIGDDTLVITDNLEPTEWDTPKSVRERALVATDPVKTVQSLPFVKERLDSVVQRVGGEQAFRDNWAINVDREVLSGFQALIQLPSGDT